MITQAILDFFRDALINWFSGFDSIMNGIDMAGAGSALGNGAAGAGHLLALFILPSMWGGVLAAWATWAAIWIVTALVGIIGRRNAG